MLFNIMKLVVLLFLVIISVLFINGCIEEYPANAVPSQKFPVVEDVFDDETPDTGEPVGGEVAELNLETGKSECEIISDEKSRDECWVKLANNFYNAKSFDELEAIKLCENVVDVQEHDSCLDDISDSLVETCEAMRTKDTDPSDWYNDCIDFVASLPTDCARIKNDDKLESECIEFVAETPEDCDLIPLENIKERCKRSFEKE